MREPSTIRNVLMVSIATYSVRNQVNFRPLYTGSMLIL